MDDQYLALVLSHNGSSVLLAGMDLLMEMNSTNYLLVNFGFVHFVLYKYDSYFINKSVCICYYDEIDA